MGRVVLEPPSCLHQHCDEKSGQNPKQAAMKLESNGHSALEIEGNKIRRIGHLLKTIAPFKFSQRAERLVAIVVFRIDDKPALLLFTNLDRLGD